MGSISSEKYIRTLKSLANRRIAAVALLGFASGLPLALTGGTLQAWMAVEGVDLKTIGFFSLVGLPYAFKFFWAPLLDRYALPFLGRRRGWILCTQFVLDRFNHFIGSYFPERYTAIGGFTRVIPYFYICFTGYCN